MRDIYDTTSKRYTPIFGRDSEIGGARTDLLYQVDC
jgi:hypothetical protein